MAGKMRQLRTVATSNPTDTAQSIQKVEKAAFDAIEALDTAKAPKLSMVKVTGGATCNARPFDFVVAYDGSYVNLPGPTPDLASSQVWVVSGDSSTIRVIPLNSKLRGLTSLNYASTTPVAFTCDGVNWW